MKGKGKAVKEYRKACMKARGQWRYDNMTAAEKQAYVAKHGPAPKPDNKVVAGTYTPAGMKAYRRWAAQAEGPRPYVGQD
jgi:hypothetical protein